MILAARVGACGAAVLTATAGLLLSALVTAPGAAAVPSSSGLSPGCLSLDGVTYDQVGHFEVIDYPFNTGEQLTATFSDPRNGATSASMTVASWTATAAELPGSVTYTFPSSGVPLIVVDAHPTGVVAVTFTCGLPGRAEDPPPWVQEVGRASADASCSAGWNPSWSRWPNGGTGGFVCVRTVASVG